MTETLRRGRPGMKSVYDMPVVQDGPPPGGFPPLRYARRLPSTGPTGFTLFAVAGAIMAYGFVKVGQTNHHRRALKQEKLEARTTLVPILQAEEDRRWVKWRDEKRQHEEEVMQQVPGWEMHEPIYKTGRWVSPARPVGIWGGG
ncbi:hypothetical protein WJX74_001235 [Apatococcus lobatus]|uniref:NADH dehydrogenase [ubiquinone] 1 alpha subcomplex subunit 13 n=1 Tax=Apatococcus lobatus TaxID=904363 RepID=A0AAW1QN54_9CHLO